MPTLTDHAGLSSDELEDLARSVEKLVTLEQVLRWGLALPEERIVIDVVVQDEYSHDAIMEWKNGAFVVFDTT